jgi:hypothetical protein
VGRRGAVWPLGPRSRAAGQACCACPCRVLDFGGSEIAKELIELKAPVERAILVGAPRKGSRARHSVAEHLEALERLVDTAGGVVVGEVTQ